MQKCLRIENMKFTEEQYQKIVEVFEKVNDEYNMGFLNPNVVTFFQDKLYKEFGDVMYFVEDWQFITAFANPLTREWAHDQFVEKEKKYYWTSKGEDSKGLKRRLYIKADRVRDYFEDEFLYNENEALTEQQVYQWGYNPEMFYREEIQ